jgi:hypothetical protein
MSRLLSLEDAAMNAEELVRFKQLLAAYEQALRLQRMRERSIETLGLPQFYGQVSRRHKH